VRPAKRPESRKHGHEDAEADLLADGQVFFLVAGARVVLAAAGAGGLLPGGEDG